MGRLIDADALIEEIRNGDKVASFNYFLSLVQAQPTAYDVEKVVEELEVLHELVNNNQKLVVKHTIDIVKRGGIG